MVRHLRGKVKDGVVSPLATAEFAAQPILTVHKVNPAVVLWRAAISRRRA
jgi:hypothetical protein